MYRYSMYPYILIPAHNIQGWSVFRVTNRFVTLNPTPAGGELLLLVPPVAARPGIVLRVACPGASLLVALPLALACSAEE